MWLLCAFGMGFIHVSLPWGKNNVSHPSGLGFFESMGMLHV